MRMVKRFTEAAGRRPKAQFRTITLFRPNSSGSSEPCCAQSSTVFHIIPRLTEQVYLPRIRLLWLITPRQKEPVPQSKDFISIRLDTELKAELQKAAELERRSISNFGRLLIEYAWSQYLKAGSMRELIAQHEHSLDKER
jgi:hypothetical protein